MTRDRSAAATFLALTFGLSAVVHVLAVIYDFGAGAAVFMMLTPGVAALLTMRLVGRNWRELGFRRGRTRYLLLSAALPIGISSLVYGVAWAAGWAGWNADAFAGRAQYLAFLVGFGLIASTVQSLGEELGWRGLLVPELARKYSFTVTALISGVIWCCWHYPSMWTLGYHGEAPRAFEIVALSLQLMAASFVMTWLRLKSSSVWTAAILHGVHNLYTQNILDPMTTDTGITEYVVGEYGLGLVVGWGCVAWLCWRLRDRLPATPV